MASSIFSTVYSVYVLFLIGASGFHQITGGVSNSGNMAMAIEEEDADSMALLPFGSPTGRFIQLPQCGGPRRTTSGEQCGRQGNGTLCPHGLCCSQFGWCGNTDDYCNYGCQSQCGGSTPSTPSASGGIGSIITEAIYNHMLKYSNDARCPSNGFYNYTAFIVAAQSFLGFGTTGDDATRKRELAAFFGQTSHETTGGWPAAPDGPYAWGYCFIMERNQDTYCTPNQQWPCAAGQKYYGRGPIQLTHNFNYGPAGRALGLNLLSNPDLVGTDPTIAFKTAIWFWMTPQQNKPSCHDVITGRWQPSSTDVAAGRVPGYGVITNIINGGLECGLGSNDKVADRLGFYKRYCDILHVGYGNNLDCYNQTSF